MWYNIISYVAHRLCFQTGLTCYALLPCHFWAPEIWGQIHHRCGSPAPCILISVDMLLVDSFKDSHTDTHRDMIFIYDIMIYIYIAQPVSSTHTQADLTFLAMFHVTQNETSGCVNSEVAGACCEVRMKVNKKCLKSRFACCLFLSHCGTWEISQVCRMWHSASHRFKEYWIEKETAHKRVSCLSSPRFNDSQYWAHYSKFTVLERNLSWTPNAQEARTCVKIIIHSTAIWWAAWLSRALQVTARPRRWSSVECRG